MKNKYKIIMSALVLLSFLLVLVLATPELTQVKLNYDGLDLTVTTDLDTDPNTQLIYRWIVDGNDLMELNMPFEGECNATYSKDYSTNGYSGTVINADFNSTGDSNGFGAYEFDGVGDYIRLDNYANMVPGTKGFTLMAWVNYQEPCQTTDCSYDVIFSTRDLNASSTEKGVALAFVPNINQNTTVVFQMSDGSTTDNIYTNVANYYDDWHHVTVTRDSAVGVDIYIDGINIKNSAYSSSNIDVFGASPRIGGNALGAEAKEFNGTIDDFRWYNRSLGSAEIVSIFEGDSDFMDRTEINAFEGWEACVTPTNGTVDGSVFCSGVLTTEEHSCGETINSAFNLYSDITCDNTAFTINASNIVISCHDSNVNYGLAGENNSYGFRFNSGVNNVTIQNCNINEVNSSGTNDHGIALDGDSHFIAQSEIQTLSAGSHGILSSEDDLLQLDTITIITDKANSDGLHLYRATNFNFTNVDIEVVRSDSDAMFFYESSYGVIEDSTVKTDSANSNGYLFINSHHNTMASCDATIWDDSSKGYFFKDYSVWNEVNGGEVHTTGSLFSHGVLLYNGSDNNLVSNLNISTTGINSRAIIVNEGSEGNTIQSNTIYTNGNGGTGISVIDSGFNTFDNNNITTTNSSGVYLYQLGAINYVVDNYFLNNPVNSLTNLEIEDLSSDTLKNRLTYENSDAKISWNLTNLTTGMSLIVDNNIFLEDNKAGIDTDVERFNLDGEATISLSDLPWNYTPQVRLDGNSVPCPADNCLISYNTITKEAEIKVTDFKFGGTEMSNYTTDFLGPMCGETMYIDFNMTRNLVCDYHGIIIGNDDVVGNGKGYNLTYGMAGVVSSAFGIRIDSNHSADLSKFNIYLGNNSGTGNYAVYGGTSNDTNIHNNYIYTNTTTGTGIRFDTSDNLTMENNVIDTHGSTSDGIESNAITNSLLNNNTITTTGATSWGIQLKDATELTDTTNNVITTSGTNSAGIALNSGPNRLIISGNNVTTSGANGYPMFLTGNVYSAIMLNNNFLSSGFDDSILDSTDALTKNHLRYGNDFGYISWDNNTFLYDLDVDQNIGIGTNLYIENNLIGLNSDVFNTSIQNTSADIKFYGLTYESQPYLLKDGVRCDEDPELCTIDSYNSLTGTLVATVTSFSNYTTSDSIQEDAQDGGGGAGGASGGPISCLDFKKTITTFAMIGETTIEKVEIENNCGIPITLDPSCDGTVCQYLSTEEVTLDSHETIDYELVYTLPAEMEVSKFTGNLEFTEGSMVLTMYSVKDFNDKFLQYLMSSIDIPAQSLFGEDTDVVFGIPVILILLLIVLFTTLLSYLTGRKAMGTALSIAVGFVSGIILDVLFVIWQIK